MEHYSRGLWKTSACDQIVLSMWLVLQMLISPLTASVCQKCLEGGAAEVADAYTRYHSVAMDSAAIDRVAFWQESASAVHSIRVIAACVRCDLAHACEGENRLLCAAVGRPFCGPYTKMQWGSQRALAQLIGPRHIAEEPSTAQAAAMASLLELTRTYPHAVHELVTVGGLKFAARLLTASSNNRQGQSVRLTAQELLHAVAVYREPTDACSVMASAAA